MSVEQIKTPTIEDKDLHDFSSLHEGQESIDFLSKMEGLLGKTEKHADIVKEENDSKVIAMAQERLGVLIGENPEEQNDFINMLDSSLVV